MNADNPFFHRGAIRRARDFHGRSGKIHQILGLLRNGQSVSIVGPRRIGKSSLLLHLCRPEARTAYGLAPPEALFVLVDCQELGGSPPEEIYETLFTGLMDRAEASGLELDNSNEPGTYRALDRALHKVSRAGKNVVLLLDEFELLAANEQLTPYFFARLRGLTTKYGLAYLTASQRPLFDITADESILSSPFFNIFVTLPLGLFTSEEARELIQLRLENNQISFSTELTDYLIHLVGTNPYFLHIGGYHIFQYLVQAAQNAQDIPLAFHQLDQSIEVEAASHLGYLWRNLSAAEQYALAILSGPVSEVRLLEQQCLIETDAEGEHKFAAEIIRRFVRRQGIPDLIQAEPFVIDPKRHQVRAHGDELSLTRSQFELLARMCREPGQVVTSDDLEIAVRGEVLQDDPDRLKTLIKRLRRAIEPYDNWIVSERGVGYALRRPD